MEFITGLTESTAPLGGSGNESPYHAHFTDSEIKVSDSQLSWNGAREVGMVDLDRYLEIKGFLGVMRTDSRSLLIVWANWDLFNVYATCWFNCWYLISLLTWLVYSWTLQNENVDMTEPLPHLGLTCLTWTVDSHLSETRFISLCGLTYAQRVLVQPNPQSSFKQQVTNVP